MVKTKKAESYLEDRFDRVIKKETLPAPTRQYPFHRFWFDFAWPLLKIAVEIDGGTYMGGNHVRGEGYKRDCIKNNMAQKEGWIVLRADRSMINDTMFIQTIRFCIRKRIGMRSRGLKF